MLDEQLAKVREKLQGYSFTVEHDPDNHGFFSVYADKDGVGAEVTGKIGEKCVAITIAALLEQLCR